MFCRECSEKIEAEAEFCSNCGTRVRSVGGQEAKGKSSKLWISLTIVACLLLGGGVGGYLLLTKKEMPVEPSVAATPGSYLGRILSGFSKDTETYYPLKEGRTWEYQMSAWSMLGSGGTAKVIVTNFAPRELKGKKVTPQKVDVDGESYFTFISEEIEGICEYAWQPRGAEDPEIKANPNYFLKYPIKVGTSWDDKTETFSSDLLMGKVPVALKSTIESIDEIVTVPAGTFKGCVKVKSTGTAEKIVGTFMGVATINVEHYVWYVPGIGKIKSIIKERSNHLMVGSGEMTLEMEAFKK